METGDEIGKTDTIFGSFPIKWKQKSHAKKVPTVFHTTSA